MPVQEVDIKIDNKPMMADAEIEIISGILDKLKPAHCLEWGSGSSTTYFPKGRDFIKEWIAVEHNGHYLDYVRDHCPPNVQTLWVLPGSSYADIIQRSNRKFDFIFIDGLDRAKCLENALLNISKDGVILLHDAGRKEYKEIIEEFNGEVLIGGETPTKDGYFAHRGLALFRGKS